MLVSCWKSITKKKMSRKIAGIDFITLLVPFPERWFIMKETQNKVINLVSQVLQCEPESLAKDSRLGRHENWDSMAQLTILLMLEETYGIIVDENNIDQLLSIDDICNYIDNMGL